MKKLNLLLIAFAFVLFSCKKNESANESANESISESEENNYEEKATSEWIVTVYEFIPAPGQFQNKVPNKSLLEEAQNIVGDNSQFISLGNFGGYVIFGFDGYIENKNGDDLAIFGNSFKNSSEPGIVMISYDKNGNGKPDDKWYELKGSEYYKPETIKGYEITYFKPKQNEDSHKIMYSNNKGVINGTLNYKAIKIYHPNAMYPLELGDSCTLKGTLLKNNCIRNGTIIENPAYDYGYVDNKGHENSGDLRGADLFDFDNAVDENGSPVKIDKIHFIKVYNATLSMDKSETISWIGERSCEVTKAKRLH